MRRTTLAGLTAALALGALAPSALADPPACPPTDDSCLALAGRLDTLQTTLTANGAKLDELDATLAAQAGAPVSGTVALDETTSDRLDLTWWGIWALVGFGLLAIIAPAWRRVFTWGSSGGNA